METVPASAPDRLGFGAVRERVVRGTQSDAGRRRAQDLKPDLDHAAARVEIERVYAIQAGLEAGDPLPEIRFDDVAPLLARSRPAAAYLEPEELAVVRDLARCAARVRAFLARCTTDHPVLAPLVDALLETDDLAETIDALVTPEGSVRDDASEALRQARRDQDRAHGRLRTELDRAMRHASGEGWAMEDQPTVRGGRLVVPVRAEAKRKLPGIVHDVSASGQTVFIEPRECVELNNALRELEAAERREIVRLLTAATDRVRQSAPALSANADTLTGVDVTFAKARVAKQLRGVVPRSEDEGVIDVTGARNAELMLQAGHDAVVPLDLVLGRDCCTLVLSGPNAGGKSVAMKTVGLMACLLAAGIPVPAAPGSRFDRFDRLMADIGDDQSVADDLSTFSSHVARMRQMLERADARSLVLIDEAGTGTDPDEGSALAQAALEGLHAAGARSIATTHHGPLKQFAHETAGACNGMMRFDVATLRPTYRFEAGLPGASYAFEIADRLGLPDAVTERARTLLGSGRAAFEKLLADLAERNEALEREVRRARTEANRAATSRATLEERLAVLTRERDGIRRNALDEAAALLASVNAEVERAVREIREAQADRDVTRAARERLSERRDAVESERRRQGKRAAKRSKPRTAKPAASTPGPGDRVVIDGGSHPGEVLEIRGGEAVVAVGSAHMRVALDRLTRVAGPSRQQVTVRRTGAADGPSAARLRIDVRGQRAAAALSEVVRLVDEALAGGVDRVEILHGKGTGALRAAIHEYLDTREDIAGYDEAPVDQGGAGITVVNL